MESRIFLDNESGKLVTITQLKKEYDELIKNNEIEYVSFGGYIKNCTHKNGTLAEI